MVCARSFAQPWEPVQIHFAHERAAEGRAPGRIESSTYLQMSLDQLGPRLGSRLTWTILRVVPGWLSGSNEKDERGGMSNSRARKKAQPDFERNGAKVTDKEYLSGLRWYREPKGFNGNLR